VSTVTRISIATGQLGYIEVPLRGRSQVIVQARAADVQRQHTGQHRHPAWGPQQREITLTPSSSACASYDARPDTGIRWIQ